MLAFFQVAPEAVAQYRFDSWGADEGLPQNSVKAITQTRDGYLWFSTSDGLVRFDGARFTIFNKSRHAGINSNRFTWLYEAPDGALWSGTENGGVTRYAEGKFRTWTTQQGLNSDWVSGVSGDKQGHIWALSDNRVLQWEEDQFQPAAAETFPAAVTAGNGLIDRTGQGGLWGVNKQSLYVYREGQMHVWTRRDGLPSLEITAVAADEGGVLWAATMDAGLIRIADGKVAQVYGAGRGLPGDWVWLVDAPALKVFSKDKGGALWLTDLASWQSRLLSRQPPPELVSLNYYRLLEDREGNLWIGTEGRGLYRARPQAVTVYSKELGLANTNTYPIVEDLSGGIWLATDDLSRFKDGRFTPYTRKNSALNWVLGGLFVDRAGQLWVGAESGLQIFTQGGFKLVKELSDLTHHPYEIAAMCQDREGNYWFGARGGRLIRYRDGVPAVYTKKDGLASDDIRVIIEDATGAIWIGAYGGLTRFKDGQFTAWTEAQGLPGNSVRALYSDAEGALWIGTYDSGLGRFKDHRFTRYTTRDGLFNDGVFQILEDGRGNLWMSCNRGIYRVKKEELNDFAAGRRRNINSVAYGKSDGMLSAECNGGAWPAGIRARDGRLWFPTQDGAAVIDPSTITINKQPPPVVIEALSVDHAPISMDRPVRIAPEHESFEIEYTALSFINAENVRFKYQMAGLERDWVDAGTKRAAYYSRVPPGEYIFKVIAANSDGVWNDEGRSLLITVLPPFYRTWWFRVLAGLIVIGTVVSAYRLRIRHFQRRQQQQELFARQLIESQEAERQRIAAELHDGLGQHLIIIKNWAALGINLTEPAAPVREQLGEISTTALAALNEVRGIVHNLRPYQLDDIGLTETIEFMLEQVTAASGIEFKVDLASLDGLFTPEGEVTFYRIVQECINNIVKHAQATRGQVLIEREGRSVQMTITDDGRGFVPAANKRGGFGLAGLQERVRMLGGEMTLRSAPGKGTHIFIRIEVDAARISN